MRCIPKRQRDPQREIPLHQCAQCGGELYPGAACWIIHGRIFCESCLTAWALAELSCFRHICGEAEE